MEGKRRFETVYEDVLVSRQVGTARTVQARNNPSSLEVRWQRHSAPAKLRKWNVPFAFSIHTPRRNVLIAWRGPR